MFHQEIVINEDTTIVKPVNTKSYIMLLDWYVTDENNEVIATDTGITIDLYRQLIGSERVDEDENETSASWESIGDSVITIADTQSISATYLVTNKLKVEVLGLPVGQTLHINVHQG